jgi:uncharacterized protein with gpF-like domain
MKPTAKPAGEPPDDIRRYLESKGLRPSWSWRDVWQEEHAVAFAVAKAMTDDVLAALQQAVADAVASGLPFSTFRKNIETTLAELGWWGFKEQKNPDTGKTERVELGTPRRLNVIYQTNGRVARAVGQWQRIQRTKSSRPYLLYELGPSQVHRPEHEAWAGTIRKVDDPLWLTLAPPNGWGCKCRLRQLSQREADDAGGETTGPELEWVETTDEKTGDTVRHPKGVDPEWAYNPGEAARPAG